jgi:ribosome-binding factor A
VKYRGREKGASRGWRGDAKFEVERSRRQGRVGALVQQEIAGVIRSVNSVGSKRIPAGVQQLISVVDVDLSPDLRNAKVKVSVIGDKKDKISAMRWLQGNAKGLRYEFAKRNRAMKRIPMMSFYHVDVGAATDTMVALAELRREAEEAALRRGESIDDEDGDDAWLEGEDEVDWLADEDVDDWLFPETKKDSRDQEDFST